MITGTDNRFKNLERKVGIFVIAAVAGCLGVVLFIAVESDLFKTTYAVKCTAPKGTGFSQGMPIKLSGFRIGRVKSITLNDSAAVDVVLQIDHKYRKWIRKDSEAKLVKEGMIGDYIVEISSGSSQELIPENGVITLAKTKSFDELAEDIADKVKPVLMDVRDIISYINDKDGDIKQTIHKLNTFTGNLEMSRSNADRLMKGTGRSLDSTFKKFDVLLTKAENRIDQAGPVIDKLDSSMKKVDTSLPAILEKVDSTLVHVEALSKDLKSTSADSLPHIPKLLDKTEGVIDQGEGVLEGMKWIWPLSTVIQKQEEKGLIRGDGRE